MEIALDLESKNMIHSQEELLKKLDAGIQAMEQGDVISHEEAMRMIRTKLGLQDV